MTVHLVTIGVYGFTAETFLDALSGAGVTVLVDLRQRRGVRGPDYAWANAARLQTALAGVGFGYRHVRGLAPTTELRELQYREDDRRGVGKRDRVVLAAEYAARYTGEILDPFDLDALVAGIAGKGTDEVPALFCVERDARACHRSLVAERLSSEYGWRTADLHPPSE